jgi:hypothetical protein
MPPVGSMGNDVPAHLTINLNFLLVLNRCGSNASCLPRDQALYNAQSRSLTSVTATPPLTNICNEIQHTTLSTLEGGIVTPVACADASQCLRWVESEAPARLLHQSSKLATNHIYTNTTLLTLSINSSIARHLDHFPTNEGTTVLIRFRVE